MHYSPCERSRDRIELRIFGVSSQVFAAACSGTEEINLSFGKLNLLVSIGSREREKTILNGLE